MLNKAGKTTGDGAASSWAPDRVLAPGFVLVLGLFATVVATLTTYRFVTDAERARFERLVAVTLNTIDDRLKADEDAVHAAAGLFAARGELTQNGFARFVAHLSPTWRVRTRSVGLVERRKVKTEGAPENQSDAFIIRYVHPSGLAGLDQVGKNLGADPTVLNALHRAAAVGDVTSSRLVRFSPDDESGGFFMFFPVYRTGVSVETPVDRREALRGFVFTTASIDSLTESLDQSRSLDTTIGAGPAPAGVGKQPRMQVHWPLGPASFELTRSVRIGDQQWPVHFQTTDVFARDSPWSLIYLTILVTLIITLLFTAVTWSESRARAQAELINRQLAESEEALKRANRAKDEFLGVVSHELRNPLGAMAGAINVLRMRNNLGDPAAKRALEIADRQVKHQSRLVDDLLDVTRLSTGNILLEIKPVDLNHIAERAVADTRSQASERHHELSFSPCASPVIVDGDAVRLGQVVSNLIMNSIRYTPDGGSIDVEVKAAGNRAHVVVRDDGAGIPPDIIDHVFSPFYQERLGLGASKGMGLGLTIVQRLVALHGGAVAAHSKGRDQGAEFTVDLPRSESRTVTPSHARAPAPLPQPAKPGRVPRIVVVDDLADGREVLRVLLESMGVEVDDASTGQGGLDLIEQSEPDMALIDIDLPDITGLEVARRIRKSGRANMVLVAVTGFGGQDYERRALEAGFDEYLVKPIDVSRLNALVQELSGSSIPGPSGLLSADG